MFGPILHVVRFAGDRLGDMIDAINGTGYGLTLGVHSRIDQTVDLVLERARAGNIYVNRNMIGAVVGVQPFGGERLSGTGPKAGGPHYLARFATERTISVNTAAVGGNASLLSLEDDLPPPSGPRPGPRQDLICRCARRKMPRSGFAAEGVGRIDAQALDLVREELQLLERVLQRLLLGMAQHLGIELRLAETGVDVALELDHVDAVGGEAAERLVERGRHVAHPEQEARDHRALVAAARAPRAPG